MKRRPSSSDQSDGIPPGWNTPTHTHNQRPAPKPSNFNLLRVILMLGGVFLFIIFPSPVGIVAGALIVLLAALAK